MSKDLALLVIDTQHIFCAQDGYIAQQEHWDVSPIETMLEKLGIFIEEARRREIPILWIRADLRKSGPFGDRDFDWYKVRPLPQETQLRKYHCAAFGEYAVQKAVQNLQRSHLLITGVYTSECIYKAAMGAQKRYKTTILRDLVAEPAERTQQGRRALQRWTSSLKKNQNTSLSEYILE